MVIKLEQTRLLLTVVTFVAQSQLSASPLRYIAKKKYTTFAPTNKDDNKGIRLCYKKESSDCVIV